MKPLAKNQPVEAGYRQVPRKRRLLLSALLLAHVFAVFVGPWAMPPQGSQLASSIAAVFGPYLQALYLDNGYRFFAPEPGPSHLIRYEADLPNGETVEGIFPTLKEQWPRLLYHRYFMLSEFAYSLESRATFLSDQKEQLERAGEQNVRLTAQTERAGELSAAYAAAYARHLKTSLGAKELRLYIRTRRIPSPEQIEQGMSLDNPALYSDELLGVDSDTEESP